MQISLCCGRRLLLHPNINTRWVQFIKKIHACIWWHLGGAIVFCQKIKTQNTKPEDYHRGKCCHETRSYYIPPSQSLNLCPRFLLDIVPQPKSNQKTIDPWPLDYKCMGRVNPGLQPRVWSNLDPKHGLYSLNRSWQSPKQSLFSYLICSVKYWFYKCIFMYLEFFGELLLYIMLRDFVLSRLAEL